MEAVNAGGFIKIKKKIINKICDKISKMNFIPEALKENCGSSITTVWLAGTLSDRMFRQTLNRKQIAAFDISPAR